MKVMQKFHADEPAEQVVLCWNHIATSLEFVSLLCQHPCSVAFYIGLFIYFANQFIAWLIDWFMYYISGEKSEKSSGTSLQPLWNNAKFGLTVLYNEIIFGRRYYTGILSLQKVNKVNSIIMGLYGAYKNKYLG